MNTINSSQIESFLTELKDFSLSYNDIGKGHIPIIFLHGFPFDKSSWDKQLHFLKESERVIAIDIRGFGKSTLGNEEATIEMYADDLISLMDDLSIDKAIVCGLSMGGYIVLNAVNRYQERFEAIILCDTQCIADSAEQKEGRMATIKEIKQKGLENFADKFIENAFFKDALIHKKEVVRKTKNVILETSIEAVMAGLNALATRHDSCSELSKIYVPTLIICGKEDKITPPIQSKYFHSNIKGSKICFLENAGHLSNLECPNEFNEAISEFIKSLEI